MLIPILQIILLFILPVILVYFKIIPFKYRRHILVGVSILTLIIIILERWPPEKLGIRFDNIVACLIPYIIFTSIGVLAIIIIAKILKRSIKPGFYADQRYLLIILLGSILQELLFRGFLIPKLQYIFINIRIVILINAILFMFIHIVYSNTPTTLISIFIAGLGFAGMYVIYPNIILVSLAHIILNHTVVRFNFYSEEKVKRKK